MRRTAVLAAAAVLLPAAVALSACSGSSTPTPKAAGTTSPGPAADPTASPDASAARPPAAAGRRTLQILPGSQLKSLLAPQSYFPSGFTSVAAETQDSGDAYGLQATIRPSGVQCPLFDTNSIVTITGYSPVAYAQSDYQSKTESGQYAEEIDEFSGDAPQGLMDTLSLAATACASYTDAVTSSTAHVTQSTAVADGQPALVFIANDGSWPGGVTTEAVEVGPAVVTVMVSTSSADNGTAEAAKLAATVVANVIGKS